MRQQSINIMFLFIFFISLPAFSVSFTFELITRNNSGKIVKSLNVTYNIIELARFAYYNISPEPPKKRVQFIVKPRNVTTELEEYMEHIKNEGVKQLMNFGKKIMTDLGLTKTFFPKMEIVTINYVSRMSDYYDKYIKYYTMYVYGNKSRFHIDKEFILLNILETGLRTVHMEQKKLLDGAVIKANFSNNLSNDKVMNIIDSTKKQNYMMKYEEVRHICIEYEICRTYPAFSEYVEYTINEILQLNDHKLTVAVKMLTQIITDNNITQAIIAETEHKDEILGVIRVYFHNIGDRTFLQRISNFLNDRQNFLRSDDIFFKTRVQTARFFFDLLDQMTERQSDQLMFNFQSISECIQKYSRDEILLQKIVLKKSVVNILKTVFDDELSVYSLLVEVIVRGTLSQGPLQPFPALFAKGFKGVY